ncbi:hydroxysteroid 11-beta-dehydrogenase 1-like protein isoform X2 [Ptychodera flava]|uniref:hydroxysteroid 11-beta-dehydrogenase 1-like protein isoform X2 n=1 Tax=Ptychodera flava TaxID=63121 RepID=UPI00396A84D0
MTLAIKITGFLFTAVAIYVSYCVRSNFDSDALRGKSVVITGASSGIGEELAYHFARLGSRILITARRENLLQQVAEKCRSLGAQEVHFVSFDMAKYNETHVVTAEIKKKLGDLDFLILNHALYYWKRWDGDLSRLVDVMNINFMSFVAMTTDLLPLLQNSNGSVTAVSSVLGNIGLPYVGHYSASKHAIHGFFRSLRHELVLSSIDVSVTVCVLGGVSTEHVIAATKGILHPAFFSHSPSAAAEFIVRSAATRRTDVYYPWFDVTFFTEVLDGYFPGLVRWFHNPSNM